MKPLTDQHEAPAAQGRAASNSELFRKAVATAMIPVVAVTLGCGGGESDWTSSADDPHAEVFESAAEMAERVQAARVVLPAAEEARMLADIEAEDRRIAELKASMTPEAWEAAVQTDIQALQGSGLEDVAFVEGRARPLTLTSTSSTSCRANFVKTIPMTMNFSRLAHRVATTSGLSNFIYSPNYRGPRLSASGSVAVNANARIFYAWHHVPTSCASLTASNTWSVWAASMVGMASALGVIAVGLGLTVTFAPGFAPYAPYVVGCVGGAAGSVVTSRLLGNTTAADTAARAAIDCVRAAAIVGLGAGFRAMMAATEANISAGEMTAVGWINRTYRATAGPAVNLIARTAPATL